MTNYNIANLGCVIIPMHQFIIGMSVAVSVWNYHILKFCLKSDRRNYYLTNRLCIPRRLGSVKSLEYHSKIFCCSLFQRRLRNT